MKALTKHWLRWYNYLLAGILTLLGFSGCVTEAYPEYGMPTEPFQVKGKVINAKQQKLPDMQVVVGRPSLLLS